MSITINPSNFIPGCALALSVVFSNKRQKTWDVLKENFNNLIKKVALVELVLSESDEKIVGAKFEFVYQVYSGYFEDLPTDLGVTHSFGIQSDETVFFWFVFARSEHLLGRIKKLRIRHWMSGQWLHKGWPWWRTTFRRLQPSFLKRGWLKHNLKARVQRQKGDHNCEQKENDPCAIWLAVDDCHLSFVLTMFADQLSGRVFCMFAFLRAFLAIFVHGFQQNRRFFTHFPVSGCQGWCCRWI